MVKRVFLSHGIKGSFLIMGLLILTAAPVLADPCTDAKRVLAAAEAKFDSLVKIRKNLGKKVEENQKKLTSTEKKYNEVGAALNRISKARSQSYDEMRRTDESSPEHAAAKSRYEQSKEIRDSALDTVRIAKDRLKDAKAALGLAEVEKTSAQMDINQQGHKMDAARDAVREACRGGFEGFIEELGLGGTGVINDYTQRARDANTEDIAIEEARRRDFDDDDDGGTLLGGGGGVATTNATFSAQCDINTGAGTNTLSANGSAFCTVNGGAPSLGGGTANITCTPGSTVAISATCSATNCRAFVNSFTNLTCPFSAPGFLTGGFGGAGGFGTNASVNCTCQ